MKYFPWFIELSPHSTLFVGSIICSEKTYPPSTQRVNIFPWLIETLGKNLPWGPQSTITWLTETLGKNVPSEYPPAHAHRPLRRLLPPIFVKRPPTSAGEIEHYLTITPCYHLTILATAGPESQAVMSLQFPLSSLSSNCLLSQSLVQCIHVQHEIPIPMQTCILYLNLYLLN